MLGPQAANYRLTGKVKPRTGSRSTNSAPRNAYRCKDGRYVAFRPRRRRWPSALCASIGRPELIDDPRYRTNAERVKNAAELDAIIGAFVAQRTQARERRVLRAGRGHHRPDLRHLADPRGPALHRARDRSPTIPTRTWARSRCTTSCRACSARRARSARPRRSSASTTASCCPSWARRSEIRRDGERRDRGRRRREARREDE